MSTPRASWSCAAASGGGPWGLLRRRLQWLSGLGLVLLGGLGACGPALAEPAGCTIVFGQGRNTSADDAAANALWDQVNLAFNEAVARRLALAAQAPATAARWGSLRPLVLKVSATDVAANAGRLLDHAVAAGCSRIVETTVFADYAHETLVARLRLHPIVRDAAPPGGGGAPRWRIAAPAFVSERQFPLSRQALDRVRPAVLAEDMTGELLAADR